MVTTRLPGPERKRQLLAVARRGLARNGFHETTMAEIAAAAGGTKPVLYQHYRSKRDLYRNVLEDIGERLRSTVIEAAAATDNPRQKVELGMAAYARFVDEDPDGFRLLFNGANRQDDEWAELTSQVERSLADAIAALIEVPTLSTERRQAMAYGVIGLAEAMTRFAQANSSNGFPAERLAGDISNLVWAGLRGIDVAGRRPAKADQTV